MRINVQVVVFCTEKCPQKNIPDEFNLGLNNRRAIYIPFAQAVPKVATIDPEACKMLQEGNVVFVQEFVQLAQ